MVEGALSRTSRLAVLALGFAAVFGLMAQPAASQNLHATLARPAVRRQMQQAFFRMVRSAVPDPKHEFAGFVPRAGFVLLLPSEKPRQAMLAEPRLELIENPDAAFLQKLAAIYGDTEVAEKLLHLCRQQEPARVEKLASYTIHRVLERLERDGHGDNAAARLSPAPRRLIARAVIEELVATASISTAERIREAIQAWLSERAIPESDVLALGFSLVESESPQAKEWEALARDPRRFSVRFSAEGFTVYHGSGEQKRATSYTTPEWGRQASALLAEVAEKWEAAGRPWMGLSSH